MEIEEENVIEVNKSLAMAAVRSVKSLDCPVCDERFQHPRMLTCLHTFCSSCIQKRVSLMGRGGGGGGEVDFYFFIVSDRGEC